MTPDEPNEYVYKCSECKETFMGHANEYGEIGCPYCGWEFEAKDHLAEGGA